MNSTQYGMRQIDLPYDLTADDLIGYIGDEGLQKVGASSVMVAPGRMPEVGDWLRERASEKHVQREASLQEAEASREASLREAEASISVGGLSVEEARKVIEALRGLDAKSAVADMLDDDLRRALGMLDPVFDAVVHIRFRRSHQPGTSELMEYVDNALRCYFDDVEPYCGMNADGVDSYDAILEVFCTSVNPGEPESR